MNKILKPLEYPSIKIKAPTPSKDYKIEEIKMTMIVKNEKLDSLEEISCDWKQDEISE